MPLDGEPFQDTERTDMAVFGELDYEIWEDRLTLLVAGAGMKSIVASTIRSAPTAGLTSSCRTEMPRTMASFPSTGWSSRSPRTSWCTASTLKATGWGHQPGSCGRGDPLSGPTLPVDYESDILENTEFGQPSSMVVSCSTLSTTT